MGAARQNQSWKSRARKAQSTIEYAMVCGIFVVALLSMQFYMKRAFSGMFRSAGDEFGDQYAPRHTTSDVTYSVSQRINSNINSIDVSENEYRETQNVSSSEDTTQTGWEASDVFENSLFN